jgi:hypothetical protein
MLITKKLITVHHSGLLESTLRKATSRQASKIDLCPSREFHDTLLTPGRLRKQGEKIQQKIYSNLHFILVLLQGLVQ